MAGNRYPFPKKKETSLAFSIWVNSTAFFIVYFPIVVFITFHVSMFYNSEVEERFNFHDSHVGALILARGGSKGIPLKNLAKISNESLLGASLKTIMEFGKFDSVWVSTDNVQIAEEAKKFKANIHMRESYTATDEAPSILGVKEFIQKHPEIDIVGLIQCTSPFLRKDYLEQAFMLLKEGYHSVFSVNRQHKLRWKLKQGKAPMAENFNPGSRPRKQDWDGEYVENGMFYFTYVDFIKYKNLLQSGRIGIVEIPSNESLEIDSPTDLLIAKAIKENSNF